MIALIAGGGLVVLVVVAVVLATTVFKPDKVTPSERLAATATSVSGARTLALKGTFTSGSDVLQGELKVTRGGRAGGQVTWGSDNVTILSADEKLYVKAPKSYWTDKITSANALVKDGDQWGKVDPTDLSLDFQKDLSPSALAGALRQAATYKNALRETKTTAQGRKALRISTPSAVFYVTDAKSPELLRYESNILRTQVDVTAQNASGGAAAISQLRGYAGELKDSFDAVGRVDLVEFDKKQLCYENSGSCRVRAKFQPPTGTNSPTKIEIKFWLTAGSATGSNLGDCSTSFTAKSTSATWVECSVKSSAWSKFSHGSQSRYSQHHQYWVSGAADSDVQALQSGFDKE
ncbi:hypothetical protein J4573_30125 [Actinomadura barringtoniae]|uniref:Uncharacterized protein n=1 Tax=Actinomadura barringtoniae TaxID=1427535 RepID=A0A939PMP2_9ACTN|nr:hypothetical protein [Actinomadura barringtoniae]MBO2451381.1 hypothetical protein [Actinomadura barringtoniae]